MLGMQDPHRSRNVGLRRVWTTLLLAIGLASAAFAESPAVLVDEAGVLSDKERDEIKKLISAYNEKGPGRIYVVVIDKLPPGTSIEQFASARINQPPLGANEKADRVLLAVAVQDRKMRIETSKDVWALLPDAFCKSVIDKVIAPRFKEKNYFQGIRDGVSALSSKLKSR